MWVMLLLIFVIMWFFMIRPQRKQQKELQKFRDSLKKGDKVVTIGGIYGTVVELKDKSVLIEVDKDVKIRVDRNALQGISQSLKRHRNKRSGGCCLEGISQSRICLS